MAWLVAYPLETGGGVHGLCETTSGCLAEWIVSSDSSAPGPGKLDEFEDERVVARGHPRESYLVWRDVSNRHPRHIRTPVVHGRRLGQHTKTAACSDAL